MSFYRKYIDKALATEGGHLSIGRGGFSIHFGLSWLSGYDCDKIKTEAISAGLPVYDTRQLPFETVARIVIRGPMAAVGLKADPEPWHSLSRAPLFFVMDAYRRAGAEIHNMPPCPTAPPIESTVS